MLTPPDRLDLVPFSVTSVRHGLVGGDALVPGRVSRPAGHEVPPSLPVLDAAGAGGEGPVTRIAPVSPAEVVAAFAELSGLPVWSVWEWWWWPLDPAGPVTLVGHCVVGGVMCSLFVDSPQQATVVWSSMRTHEELSRRAGPVGVVVPGAVAELERSARGLGR